MPDLVDTTIKKPRSSETLEGQVAANNDSMAANPNFEADAEKFEAKLGQAAYGHGASNAVVEEACQKCITYIDERAKDLVDVEELGHYHTKLKNLRNEMYAKLGSGNTEYSGIVGDGQVEDPDTATEDEIKKAAENVEKIRKVFRSGKLGERCNHIEAFYKKVLFPDLLAPKPGVKDAIKEAKFSLGQLEKAKKRAEASGKGVYGSYTEDEDIENQWKTRQSRETANGQDDVERPWESPTLGEVEGEGPNKASLSHDEKKLQGVSKKGDQLKWVTGHGTWVMNEAHKWVKAQRAASLPLVAGPSGTTNRLMQTFASLGAGTPTTRRLACIGYLLPPRHHSLVEVLTGAQSHGVSFTPGREMYTNVKPFNTTQLRAFGDGKFPHEKNPETTASSGSGSGSGSGSP